MATVMYGRTRLATYLPGLNALVQHIASTVGFSTIGSYSSGDPHGALATSKNGPLRLQHDETMGPFNVKDQLYFMPGNVGFECQLPASDQKMRLTKKMVPELLHTPSSPERCISGLLIKELDDAATTHNTSQANQDFDNSSVECVMQSCPEKLKQDLQDLFPEAPSSHVTVVTVTQKTKNEMTAWCSAVEEERDHMLDKFVDGAKEICFILQREGFWADFIDPSSGLAFFGPYTNNTLFETDDRYRLLGFQIEDLGCCRVIRHPLWGAHAFVGTIFTNAPPSRLTMKDFQGF
ncbi:metabolism of cobalamin associated Db [Hippocampus comes]|uniref:Metabolism of cobalamin associated Db n=1 Tax=Hippocampus comes TaxID=109280 RepID=A0A3Q2YC98_HIPCM|nr:PREDICTED: methylmalonic aciduria and homocystinuria type D homolog, mitochondrial-like [Hippocampus comes]